MQKASIRSACRLFRRKENPGDSTFLPLQQCLERPNYGESMNYIKYWISRLWSSEEGQDVAEYSIMLAVILVIVVGTVRLIGSNSGNVFSQVGSSIQ